MEFFKTLFSSDFLPHGTCYLWNSKIVWLHVISDSIITLSYYCIPIALIYLVQKRRDLPFNWIFWMFGLFILGCGTTHLMEVWNVWHGSYLLAGVIKAFTAAVSLATAVVLIPLLPKIVSLPAQIQLQEINSKLLVQMKERELAAEARTRLAAVVDSSEDAIVSKTLDGTITAWNPGAERLFGYSALEAVGKPMRMLLPPESANEERDILDRIGRGERVEHFETVRMRKDGTQIDVSVTISPIRDSHGAIVGASNIARDISERRRSGQALNESFARGEQALRELADQKFALDQHAIVAITDVQGTITYVNEKFCAISKYSKEELIGQNHRILNSGYHPKQFFQLMYRTIANGKVWHNEIRNRAKDGSIYWVDTTIVPFIAADGKPRQYVAIRADITERKQAGEALALQALELTRQAEQRKADEREIRDLNNSLEERVIQRTSELESANKELEAFTYSVSHDLRAPLRHIVGFSKMLGETCGSSLSQEGRHYLQRIEDGTQRMGMLVDDLLKLTRIGRHELKVQVTNLDSIVKDVIADLALDTETRVIEWKVSSLPSVKGDPALIKVVFQNLLGNAVKYTRTRAKAVIEIGGGQSALYIRDNGVGFDMKYADKLFGAFQRLHRSEEFEGTGIGLAIVQRVVQKHGGHIWAQAEPDKGATFYLSFDVVPKMPINAVPTTVERTHDYAR